MKLKFLTALLLPALFSGAIACRAQEVNMPTHSIPLDAKHVVILLDSVAAGPVITTDRIDDYFARVTAGEMSIQMKQPLSDDNERSALFPEYLDFLRSDVGSFTEKESKAVKEVFEKIFRNVNEINPAIFPDTIKLIKTHAKHYGEGVYYTRENCIVIPEKELATRKRDNFTTTMYHELFHVVSRLNPTLQRDLYRLIGFERLGLDKLDLPEKLDSRVLYNPDGVDFAQKIKLQMEDGSQIEAIPIIYSNSDGYDPEQTEFFAYLEFNLFQIKPSASGRYSVVTGPDGLKSTLNLDSLPDFFRQIKDNTGYIIHPDEVLADNFAFLVQSKHQPVMIAKFSPAGKQLLADMEAVFKALK